MMERGRNLQLPTHFSAYNPATKDESSQPPHTSCLLQPSQHHQPHHPSQDFPPSQPPTVFNIEPPTPIQTSPISHSSLQASIFQPSQPQIIVSLEPQTDNLVEKNSQKYDCGYSTMSGRLTPFNARENADDKKSRSSSVSNVEITSSFTSIDAPQCMHPSAFSFTTSVSVHENNSLV